MMPNKGFSQIAYEVFHQAMGRKPADPNKILKGVRLGRLGGLKGGKARAEPLNPEQPKKWNQGSMPGK